MTKMTRFHGYTAKEAMVGAEECITFGGGLLLGRQDKDWPDS